MKACENFRQLRTSFYDIHRGRHPTYTFEKKIMGKVANFFKYVNRRSGTTFCSQHLVWSGRGQSGQIFFNFIRGDPVGSSRKEFSFYQKAGN